MRALTCKAVIKKTEKSLGTRSINCSVDFGVLFETNGQKQQNFTIKRTIYYDFVTESRMFVDLRLPLFT